MREYIIYLVEERELSVSAQNNAINAIKIYYNDFLNKNIEDFYLPRPHKPGKLPQILSENDVLKIFKCIKNLKHKCIIYLIYSAGLTPSEVQYIKIQDIDSKNLKIFICSATRKKDRYVILSQKLLLLLRKYFIEEKPVYWLFENSPKKQYSKRTMQKIFQNAVKESAIIKTATLTILKNSFASLEIK